MACADAAAIHDLVLSWLWPLWTPPPLPMQLYFQPVVGAGTALACRAVATLQPITWASQAALTCACHGLPTAACSAGDGHLPQHATCASISEHHTLGGKLDTDQYLTRRSRNSNLALQAASMCDMQTPYQCSLQK